MTQDWHGEAVVYGKARSQGSKRLVRLRGSGRQIMLDDDKELRSWRNDLVAAMRACRPPEPIDVAVAVYILIYVVRPRGHFGAGRNAGVLKPDAPAIPPTGRDVDKVTRGIFDAGKYACWYTDDKRISDLNVKRRYADDGEGERTVVEAWAARVSLGRPVISIETKAAQQILHDIGPGDDL